MKGGMYEDMVIRLPVSGKRNWGFSRCAKKGKGGIA